MMPAFASAPRLGRRFTVSTTWPTTNEPGQVVRVTVSHDYKPLTGLGMVPSLKFTSTSEMVISY